MNTVTLSVELVNAILSYLGNQKFVEVAGMIQKIQEEAGPQVPTSNEESEVSE